MPIAEFTHTWYSLHLPTTTTFVLLYSTKDSDDFPSLTHHSTQFPHIQTYKYIKYHSIDWLIPHQAWIPYPHLSNSKQAAPPTSWLTLSPVTSSFFLCPNCKSMLFPQLPLPVCQVPSLSFKTLLKTHFFWFDFRD